jgi:predicted alpha/beta hydrolase
MLRALLRGVIATMELTFEGLGGAQTAAWIGPEAPRCVIGVVPALGLRADYYLPLAEALSGEGVAVVPIDLPGHGRSPLRAGRAEDWGYPDVVGHLSAVRTAVRGRASGARFVWLGHSIGGQIALMDGEHADGVVLVASGPPYHRAWQGLARLRLFTLASLSAAIASVLGHYPGETLGFGGGEARTLMVEWARAARTGRYAFESLDGDAAIARVRGPIHAVRVEGDELAPETAIEHTLTKASAAKITRGLYPLAEQDPKVRKSPHNRWPRSPAPVAREVRAFLAREGFAAAPPEARP